jgi:hypothetical protein
MKLLKILTYKALLFLVLLPGTTPAQGFSFEAGIYDYTDDVARDFYLLSPTILAGYDFWVINKLRFNFTTGFGYRQFKYNEDKHHLYTVPFFLGAGYGFGNNGAKVFPSLGMGVSALFKSDRNVSLSDPHQSFTYGYYISGTVNFRLPEVTLFIGLRYNHLLPPAMEEIRMRGVILSVGMKIPVLKD